nr:hypothetical protein CFP56_03111 [Quercus suber]
MSVFNDINFASSAPLDDQPSPVYCRAELVAASFQARADQLKGYEDAKSALLQERAEERSFQLAFAQQKDMLENSVRVLQDIMNKDPFVLCLLDGNAFLFDHSLLRSGVDSGERAAVILSEALFGWSQSHIDNFPRNAKVMIRVYADLNALAETCSAAGLPIAAEHLQDFFQGFMRGDDLFDFVDTGSSKDAALQKLAGLLELHTMDMHCRQIYMGCSRTDNYSSMLKAAAERDFKVLNRVTFLEGPALTDELAALQFPVATLPSILRYHTPPCAKRSDRLTQSRIEISNASAGLPRASHPFASPVTTSYTPGSFTSAPVPTEPSNHPHVWTDSTSPSLPSQADTSTSRTASPGVWAKVAQSSASLPLTDLTQRFQPAPLVTVVRRNRKGQRIDEPIAHDSSDIPALRKVKWCNQHFIGVGCCHLKAGKIDKCPHTHEGHLTNRQKNALRVIARETPCKRGTTCDDRNCIYGHRCPFPRAMEGSMRGLACLGGEHCRFSLDMHGLDNVPVAMTRVTGAF